MEKTLATFVASEIASCATYVYGHIYDNYSIARCTLDRIRTWKSMSFFIECLTQHFELNAVRFIQEKE